VFSYYFFFRQLFLSGRICLIARADRDVNDVNEFKRAWSLYICVFWCSAPSDIIILLSYYDPPLYLLILFVPEVFSPLLLCSLWHFQAITVCINGVGGPSRIVLYVHNLFKLRQWFTFRISPVLFSILLRIYYSSLSITVLKSMMEQFDRFC